ncbi:hypothetical protein D9758_018598 [Tetrapyrgos nigripes]|uniref:Uncharacterized protein n=1 Tax=Tetrapyrgos nigripes TaxID=182062 RepID=A0A8H5BXR6_9AGAR|nr:hypothetical protein D9758_018598 [Tetrapyrgos nigripes]
MRTHLCPPSLSRSPVPIPMSIRYLTLTLAPIVLLRSKHGIGFRFAPPSSSPGPSIGVGKDTEGEEECVQGTFFIPSFCAELWLVDRSVDGGRDVVRSLRGA